MYRWQHLILLSLVLWSCNCICVEVDRIMSSEERLHEHLFGDQFHDLTAFPIERGSMDLTFQVALYGADIETESETLSVDVNFIQKWTNPRLRWKPENFGNITQINIDPELAWIPDLYIQSNIEEDKEYNGMLNTLLTKIILTHDGAQTWYAPSTLSLRCTLHVQNYPFDTQTCHLQFGSFAFDSSRLNVNVKPMDLELYEDPPEWELLNADHTKVYTKYPLSSVPYTDALYVLTLRRKALAPLKLLVLPNLVLIALTFIVFVIPTDSGERIGYLFTTFLAIAFFLTDTIDTLPLSSIDVPLCMAFMGVSTISLSLLALCLCYSIGCYYANTSLVALPQQFRTFVDKCAKYFFVNTKKHVYEWRAMLDEVRSMEKLVIESRRDTDGTESEVGEQGPSSSNDYSKMCDEFFPDKKEMRFLNNKLDTLLTKFEAEDESRWRQMEWEQFSKVLDHICFAAFVAYFVLSLIVVNIRIFLVY